MLRDTRSRGVAVQAALLALVVLGLWWIVGNTVANLAAQDKSVGFGFLDQAAGFQIGATLGTWMFDYKAGESTYLDVYCIGIVNTFVVAFFGILAATVLGFLLGIMRLSENFVFRAFATAYIEITRNVPLLLQLFIWYFAVLRSLPDRRGRLELIEGVAGINITGLYLPAPVPGEGFPLTLAAVLAAVALTVGFNRFAGSHQRRTGQVLPAFWISVALLALVPAAVFLASGSPLSWDLPNFISDGPVLRQGYEAGRGMLVIPEMISVWLVLSLYTAAFIAENVRSGIQAVDKGQTEAALSMGLKPGRVLQLVVIPQALRVIIPPLTSQYLNLTKNSSLAVAIAYPELVSVFAGTALNQVGKEIEMIFMMMSVYLTFSVATALFMNWFNAKVKLVER